MTSEKEAPLRSWQEKVHAALAEAGFEPYEESGLWKKNGILFGRGAALQQAMLEVGKSLASY
jgi:hypothetical protein